MFKDGTLLPVTEEHCRGGFLCRSCCRTCGSTSVSSHSGAGCWAEAGGTVVFWGGGSTFPTDLHCGSRRSSEEPAGFFSLVFFISVTRSRMDFATALESLSWKNPDLTYKRNKQQAVFLTSNPGDPWGDRCCSKIGSHIRRLRS